MLRKILFSIFCSLLLIFSPLCLQAQEKERFQINARTIEDKEGLVTATGDAIIFSKTYYISADKIVYNKEKNVVEVFDNVTVVKDNKDQLISNYAYIDLNNETVVQTESFLVNQVSNMWMSSEANSKTKDEVHYTCSTISSCDYNDPFWSIKFSSATYDIADKWFTSYNTRLYIKDVPVFYTPYFAFSADTTRRTGLLYPTMGYSSDEGVAYEQPIYIAPSHNYDIELSPQIRIQRGVGIHGYFRLADSPYSFLGVESGIFLENSSYLEENDLQNRKHYGFNLDYKRTKLFTEDETHQDGLYINLNWLNDVDYAQIKDSRFGENDTRDIESMINYFYKTPQYYAGIYGRYYLDSLAKSNEATLQQLPQIQLHKFVQSAFLNNLTYSADMQYTNYHRDLGLNVDRYDFNIPISYGFSFFGDYLYIILKEEFSLSRLYYDNYLNFETGTLMQNKHSVEVETNLLKPYENFLHTIRLSSELSIPNTIKEDGDLYSVNTQNQELSPFPVSLEDKTLSFALSQSFNNKDDSNEILNHKLRQFIIYEDGDSRLGDLENEILLNYPLGNFYNRITYNHIDDAITESSTGFSLNYKWFGLNANHYQSKDTSTSDNEDLESYNIATTARLQKNYWLTYQMNYDLKNNIRDREAVIFTINDKCWRFNINYQKEREAINTSSGIRTKDQDIVFLELELKPLGGISQSLDFEERQNEYE